TARPDPVGEPLGTSFFPRSLADTTGLIIAVLVELASAAIGIATAATITADVNSHTRMVPPFSTVLHRHSTVRRITGSLRKRRIFDRHEHNSMIGLLV